MRNAKLVFVLCLMTMLMSVVTVVQAQDTELTITWWGSDNRHDRTIEVIEMFEAENPGVDVTYEFSGWSDYWTRVNTQAAGGSVACVMQQDYAYLTEWANRGLLLPLDEYIESGAINASSIPDSIIDSGRVQVAQDGETTDHVYGISLGSNSMTYILDADAFEEAGLELPAWDWTWDDFEQLGYQIYESTGKWIIAYGPWDDNHFAAVLLSSGQQPFTDDGTSLGWDDVTPMVEHFARIKRLMDAGAIPSMDMQADVESASPSHEQSPIIRGEEAIRFQWSNQVVSLWNAAGEDRNFVLYPVPRIEGGESANYLKPSMFFSITQNCPNPELGAQFIDYFTNSLEANEVLFAERGVPVSSEVRDHLSMMVDTATGATFDFVGTIADTASPIPPPNPVGYSDINSNVWGPMLVEPVLFGLISPEEGVETFRTEAQSILDSNQ
ncbi:MAG: ABC transporter substrate-binding protein [Anaerolineae bacterium]|nr:ABC transporter substrate-binding protein [Anaerolineae bacterium]